MKREYTYSLKSLLYYVALIIYISYTLWENTLFTADTDLSTPRLIVFFAVVALLSIKFLIDKNYKHIVPFLFIMALFIWVGLNVTNVRELILIIFFMFEARNVDLNKAFRIYARILLIGSLITVTASLFGLIGQQITSNGRHFLGFTWTTYAPNILMTILMAWAYIHKKNRNTMFTLSVLILIDIFYFFATKTKASCIENILLLVMTALYDSKILKIPQNRFLKFIIMFIFPIMFGITMLFTFYYPKVGWLQQFNSMFLNNRLNYNLVAFTKYPVNMFGNLMSWNMSESNGIGYFYVDSSYVQILLQYGVVVFVFILAIFTLLMREYIKNNDTMGVICLSIIALHSITDPQLFILMYNPFLLSAGKIIFKGFKKHKQIRTYQSVVDEGVNLS